jgi:hypothetical protein
MGDHKRPSFMPEVREFSQADARVVQRPEGLDANGEGMRGIDLLPGGLAHRYAEIQASPGRYDEIWGSPALPQGTLAGGVVILAEKDLAFPAHSFLCDNWTNQWLYDENLRRSIPPYSGGWVLMAPKGYQKCRITLRLPSPAYAPAAAIAGEYAWVGFAEAVLPPMTGIVVLTKTPVVA